MPYLYLDLGLLDGDIFTPELIDKLKTASVDPGNDFGDMMEHALDLYRDEQGEVEYEGYDDPIILEEI